MVSNHMDYVKSRISGEFFAGFRTIGFLFRITVAAVLMSLFAPGANADVVDGQPSFNFSVNRGIYVWRTSTGDWQLRVLAGSGSGSLTFNGSFSSAESVSDVAAVVLEADDQWSLDSDGRNLQFDLDAAPGSVDGLRISGAVSGVCLKSATNTMIYLGKSAVPAATPVDLTGDGACTAAVAESGLFVTDLGGGNWQVRLLTQDAQEAFSGAFETTAPVSSFRGVSFESQDSALLEQPDRLAVSMTAWPGGYDGVDFSVPAGTGVCLRAPGDEILIVYLGSGPADAVAMTTPADLTHSGACDDTPPVGLGKKFNPGHYIFMMRKQSSQLLMGQSVYPGVKGIVKRYTWKQLEPTQGNYAFSTVASDLNFVASLGLQFIVMIEDRTFVDENPLPDYLAHLARRNTSSFGLDGFTAIRWDPYLITRLNALTRAFGQQFDSHPAFEGLIPMEESAPGFPSTVLDELAYTPEKYRDGLINVLKSAAQSMPHSRVFWMMNFLPRKQNYIRDVLTAVKNDGVVLGGPDVKPDDSSLQNLVYPFYDEFNGQMPIFNQVEPICYHHDHADTSYPTKYWTMPELFAYGRDHLHANYFFWVRFPTSMYKDSYNYTHALPVIEKNPVFNRQ